MTAATCPASQPIQHAAGAAPIAPSWRWQALTGYTLLISTFALVTVFRYGEHLTADGLAQSGMSVQDVDLFFWGQDRLALVVPLLASPVADPESNLLLCLTMNAAAFYGLLLVLARMAASTLASSRRWEETTVIFLLMAATTLATWKPPTTNTYSLETQPYALSWLCAIGAFLLWRRGGRRAVPFASVLVFVAVGLNPSSVLVVAVLALVEVFRTRRLGRWIGLGSAWLLAVIVWMILADRFGGEPGPFPEPPHDYFGFDLGLASAEMVNSATSVLNAVRPLRTAGTLALACAAMLLLRVDVLGRLLRRIAVVALFLLGYLILFAGNSWVALNGYHFRYFFPLVLALAVGPGMVLAAGLLTVRLPRRVPVAIAAIASLAAATGPLQAPWNVPILTETEQTARFAAQENATFISGSYWSAWPVFHQLLDDGRRAAFLVTYKSGGDPSAYRQALDRKASEGGGPPLALCINYQIAECVRYLDYKTRPGWRETERLCPAPPLKVSTDVPQPSCRVLEFAPAPPATRPPANRGPDEL